MTQNDKILEARDLTVAFDGFTVLDNINFDVKKGNALAVIGPNGAGKTVLFRALLGLLPHGGQIRWLSGIKIGYVPQKLDIDKTMPLTVKEFLRFRSEDEAEIKKALSMVGIEPNMASEHHIEHHLLERPIGLVSGGEFQRVLIAWALIGGPDVLLFDEPTSGVDIGAEQTIYNLLKKLQREMGLTILLVSHDLNIVYKYADTVLCINKSAVCFGQPELVLKPEDLKALYGGEAEFYQHKH